MIQTIQSYEQAVQALPLRLRREALSLPEGDRDRAEELRLRVGWPMTVLVEGRERSLGGPPVERGELDQLVEIASRASLHTVLDQVRRGYLTMEGGHRIGLCGTAVLREGEIHSLPRPTCGLPGRSGGPPRRCWTGCAPADGWLER